MKKRFTFIYKLICALGLAFALNASVTAVTTSPTVNSPSHVVYAKAKKQRRWNKASAKVYLKLGKHKDLVSASKTAIKEWNKTGAFTFKRTKHLNKANIVIVPWFNSATQYAGYTTWTYNKKTKRLYNALIQLNTYYLQNYSNQEFTDERTVQAVEHELGHAIGLNHYTKGPSIMNPVLEGYGIQKIDVKHVKKLYHR